MTNKKRKQRYSVIPQMSTLPPLSVRPGDSELRRTIKDVKPFVDMHTGGLTEWAKRSKSKRKRLWAVREMEGNITALTEIAMGSNYPDSAVMAVELLFECPDRVEVNGALLYISVSAKQPEAGKRAAELKAKTVEGRIEKSEPDSNLTTLTEHEHISSNR